MNVNRWPTPLELIVWGLVIGIVGSGVFAWLRVPEIQYIFVDAGYALLAAGVALWFIRRIRRRQ